MKHFKYLVLMMFILFFSYVIFNYFKHDLDYELSKIDLTKADNLMIVAHPDDETLWGGKHLIKSNYLVVCITCGTNRTRIREIEKAMKISNDQYIPLWFPDKTLAFPDNWIDIEPKIYKELEKIIKLKKWKSIVTHNREGEYGHIHHIKTNRMVTKICEDSGLENYLYYFGKYYTKKQMKILKENMPIIGKNMADIKINEMVRIYKSQRFIRKKFNHMFLYENWIKYTRVKGNLYEDV